MSDEYLRLSDEPDDTLPPMTTMQVREQWIREFIRACVPEINDDIEAGPDAIPGITSDEAAWQFLVALQDASRTDPLALDVMVEIVGVAPLAPEGHAPVQVRWAPTRVHASGFPAFVATEKMEGLVTFARSQIVVLAAMKRAHERSLRVLALFERANAAGHELLGDAVAAGVLGEEEVDAAWDIINPPEPLAG